MKRLPQRIIGYGSKLANSFRPPPRCPGARQLWRVAKTAAEFVAAEPCICITTFRDRPRASDCTRQDESVDFADHVDTESGLQLIQLNHPAANSFKFTASQDSNGHHSLRLAGSSAQSAVYNNFGRRTWRRRWSHVVNCLAMPDGPDRLKFFAPRRPRKIYRDWAVQQPSAA